MHEGGVGMAWGDNFIVRCCLYDHWQTGGFKYKLESELKNLTWARTFTHPREPDVNFEYERYI